MAGAQGGYISLKESGGMDDISDGLERVRSGGRND
jgi:hypothetical protein